MSEVYHYARVPLCRVFRLMQPKMLASKMKKMLCICCAHKILQTPDLSNCKAHTKFYWNHKTFSNRFRSVRRNNVSWFSCMYMFMCVLIMNRKKWSVLRESIGLTWSVHRQWQRVYDQNHYFMAFISSHIHVFAFSSLVHFAFFFCFIQRWNVRFALEPCGGLFDHTVFGRCSLSHERKMSGNLKRFIKIW